ncbi:MAG: hypothetical protein AABX70_02265, partial [Nanoarchaeota archaeon]
MGYLSPSYNKSYQGQGTESLKNVGQYNTYTSKADFRKSTFRPVTRVMMGPSLAQNRQVQVLAETGSGLYVPYDTYSGDMAVKNIDVRARGGPSPYVGIYGIERQAIKSYNVQERSFGVGTGSGYINPGIPKMIRSTPQYVNAGLPALVDSQAATPVAPPTAE